MLHVFQFAPFADSARQQLFEAIRRTLQQGLPADAPALLAGPLPLPDGRVADAVLLRPHSLTLLLLQPGAGGELRIPSFTDQPWQLNNQPVTAPAGAVNPYQTFAQLRPAVLALLEPLLPPEAVNPQFVTGLWLTEQPLRFGPDVEASMAAAPEARQLQLLPELGRLPRRLAQLATPEIDLTAADIQQVAATLPTVLPLPAPATQAAEQPATLGSVVQNTARQLWRWLGAEDVDELPPDTYELAARGEDRKHELEEQQAALQQQLTEQIRAIEAREAAREQSMAQLRTELAQAQRQAAPNTQELQARLAAESRAQADAETQRQHSEQEWQRRNQDLDAKINALEQLIQRLQTPPVPAAPAPAPTASFEAPAASAPAVPVAPAPQAAAHPASRAPMVTPSPVAPAPEAPTRPVISTSPPVSKSAAPQPAAGPQPTVPPAPGATPPPPRPVEQPKTPAGPTLSQRLRAAWQQLPRLLPATDHWAWLAVGGVLVLGVMIWLSTQAFRPQAPEPYQAEGRWGFAQRGEPVIKAQYAAVQPFQDERAVVERDGVFGAVDEDGREAVPLAYDAMNDFAGGYARVRIGDLYTFVDAEGQELNHYFYNAYDFAEGYAPVLDQRGWFYLGGPETGVPAHPRIFQEAYPFHDGLARVRTGGTYTFISPEYLTDTTRSPEPFGRYEQATDFVDGRAQVQQNGRRFAIDRNGEEVTN